MREVREARHVQAREEMDVAIAEGRLTVRQMTSAERKRADRDRARSVRERAGRKAGRVR